MAHPQHVPSHISNMSNHTLFKSRDPHDGINQRYSHGQLHPHLRLHCADSPSACSAHLMLQTLSPLQCLAHPWAPRGHLCSAVTQMSLLLLIAALLKPRI